MAAISGCYWIDVLNAVKGKLETIPGLPKVMRRKRQIRSPDGRQPAAYTMVSAVSDQKMEETFAGETLQRSVVIRYTVKVTVSFQQNTQFEEDPPEPLIWREQIRQKFLEPRLEGPLPGDNPQEDQTQPLVGAPTVFDCSVELGNVYDEAGENATFDSTSVLLTFDSIEPANGPVVSNQN